MIEFKVVNDYVEYIPPSPETLDRYEKLRRVHSDDGWSTSVHYPEPTPRYHSATEAMAEMVNDGWQVHTFSHNDKGYFALMEREV